MMTDTQIAFSSRPGHVFLRVVAPWVSPRPSHLTVLFSGMVRLFHLIVPTATQEIQAASPGEAAVERALMQRFQDMIVPHLDAAYNFARFLCRDADAAQDIVQEAFLRAYRNFASYRGGDPRAWLFAIVRNCYHVWRQQHRRKARYERHMEDGSGGDTEARSDDQIPSDEDSPETATIRRSEQQRVRAVIGGLSEAMREILVLRELEDLSYRQIAEIIDAPIGTVMSRLARARHEFGEAWSARDENRTAR